MRPFLTNFNHVYLLIKMIYFSNQNLHNHLTRNTATNTLSSTRFIFNNFYFLSSFGSLCDLEYYEKISPNSVLWFLFINYIFLIRLPVMSILIFMLNLFLLIILLHHRVNFNMVIINQFNNDCNYLIYVLFFYFIGKSGVIGSGPSFIPRLDWSLLTSNFIFYDTNWFICNINTW